MVKSLNSISVQSKYSLRVAMHFLLLVYFKGQSFSWNLNKKKKNILQFKSWLWMYFKCFLTSSPWIAPTLGLVQYQIWPVLVVRARVELYDFAPTGWPTLFDREVYGHKKKPDHNVFESFYFHCSLFCMPRNSRIFHGYVYLSTLFLNPI